ncbi:MAG: response regulator [Bdellovibrionales bacterium]
MVAKLTSLKMLIVDDELGISESLKDYFELENFEVQTASSGNKALEIMNKQSFDIVISDVRMPDGDGRFLLKAIRKIHPTKPIVIMMSGFSDLSIDEVLKEGGTALLSKPFQPHELLKIVKQVINK